jgi:hypothetical protein
MGMDRKIEFGVRVQVVLCNIDLLYRPFMDQQMGAQGALLNYACCEFSNFHGLLF